MFYIEDRILMLVGALLYGGAFAFALWSLRRSTPWSLFVFNALMVGGFVFHSMGIYDRGLQEGAMPIQNLFEILHVIAWCLILHNLVLQPAFRLRALDFFGTGLAAAIGLLAFAVPGADWIPEATDAANPWPQFHAFLAVLSYGIFGILALTSMMFLIQNFGLHRRRSGGIFTRLPAIRKIEDINGKLILMGVTILSISLAIGALNLLQSASGVGGTKLAIAMAVWAGYLVLLILRQQQRLFGEPFAWACVAMFAAALISLEPLITTRQPDTGEAAGSSIEPKP